MLWKMTVQWLNIINIISFDHPNSLHGILSDTCFVIISAIMQRIVKDFIEGLGTSLFTRHQDKGRYCVQFVCQFKPDGLICLG